jgi:hypothetical protein
MPDSGDSRLRVLEEQVIELQGHLQAVRAARTTAEQALALVRDTLAREVDETYANGRGEYRAGLERAMVLIDRQLA